MSEGDIGKVGEPFEWVVDPKRAAQFKQALGFGGADPMFAPMTFATTSGSGRGPESMPRLDRPMDPGRVLHAGQEYRFARAVRVGEVLRGVTRIKDVFHKHGARSGEMRFVVYETVFSDSDGHPVMWAESTLAETSAVSI